MSSHSLVFVRNKNEITVAFYLKWLSLLNRYFDERLLLNRRGKPSEERLRYRWRPDTPKSARRFEHRTMLFWYWIKFFWWWKLDWYFRISEDGDKLQNWKMFQFVVTSSQKTFWRPKFSCNFSDCWIKAYCYAQTILENKAPFIYIKVLSFLLYFDRQ